MLASNPQSLLAEVLSWSCKQCLCYSVMYQLSCIVC